MEGKKENVIEKVTLEYDFHRWRVTCKREGTEKSRWTASLGTTKYSGRHDLRPCTSVLCFLSEWFLSAAMNTHGAPVMCRTWGMFDKTDRVAAPKW